MRCEIRSSRPASGYKSRVRPATKKKSTSSEVIVPGGSVLIRHGQGMTRALVHHVDLATAWSAESRQLYCEVAVYYAVNPL